MTVKISKYQQYHPASIVTILNLDIFDRIFIMAISLNFIFDIIYLTKHYTNHDDNFHITAILK